MPALQSLVTLLLVLAAFGYTLKQLGHIGVLVNTGARVDEDLKDRPGERWGRLLALTFGHRRVLRDPFAGSLHVVFLFGFFILGVGHVEVVLEGLTAFLRHFGRQPLQYAQLPFLPGRAIALYHFSQDVLAGLVLVASAIALARRWSGAVKRLQPRSMDAEMILYLIVALYVTFFGLVGSTVYLHSLAPGGTTHVTSQPFSSLLAGGFASMGLSAPAALWIHHVSWWCHVVVFLGFACYITGSKHMHLVYAWPNIWFFRRTRAGLPPKLDFENSEKFGIDRVQELPWKSLLDTYACTECGRCNAVCPAHQTGKPLMPMKVLHDVKLNLRYRNGDDLLKLRDPRGRPIPEKKAEEEAWEPKVPLISKAEVKRDDPAQVRPDGGYLQVQGQIHVDEAWACTTCAACVEACPVLIDSVPGTLIGLRQSLVMMESEFPQEATTAFKGMEVQGNPWGVGQDRREEWAEELDVPVMSKLEGGPREVEYLFWVGCAGATDPRARKTQQALVKILKAAKVDFAILGCEEKCTGDPARRMGNEYVFNELATHNVETLGKYKFKKIVATCPHCFNSLGKEYGELGVDYEVLHHTELLADLLKSGRIPLDAARQVAGGESVTFHDPCYLGRYNQGYEPPREILTRLGAKTTEMAQSRERGFCCGAGGGRVFMEETLGSRVNVARTEQALETGARTLAVGCPFCMTMLTDGTKAKEAEERLQVRDLAELVAERLPEAPS